MRTKLLCLTCFVAVAAMAQRQEVNLTEWQYSQDGKNKKLVSVPYKGKGGTYLTRALVKNEYEYAELQFGKPLKGADIYINGKKLGKGETSDKGYRVDASVIFQEVNIITKTPDGQKMLDGPRMVHEIQKEAVIKVETDEALNCPVKLVCSGMVGYGTRIDDWSVYARTVSADADKAVIEIGAKALRTWGNDSLSFTVYSPADKFVAYAVTNAKNDKVSTVQIEIPHPQLSTKNAAATYEVDIALFATAKNFSTGKPEAHSRDSYRLPFIIKGTATKGKKKKGKKH